MEPRLRRRTWTALLERLLLDADLWLAARLNTRPAADTLLDVAAWAGRLWRHSYTTARQSLYGPGRGVLAVITKTKKETGHA